MKRHLNSLWRAQRVDQYAGDVFFVMGNRNRLTTSCCNALSLGLFQSLCGHVWSLLADLLLWSPFGQYGGEKGAAKVSGRYGIGWIWRCVQIWKEQNERTFFQKKSSIIAIMAKAVQQFLSWEVLCSGKAINSLFLNLLLKQFSLNILFYLSAYLRGKGHPSPLLCSKRKKGG